MGINKRLVMEKSLNFIFQYFFVLFFNIFPVGKIAEKGVCRSVFLSVSVKHFTG